MVRDRGHGSGVSFVRLWKKPLGVRRYSPCSFRPSSGAVWFDVRSFLLRHFEKKIYVKENEREVEGKQKLKYGRVNNVFRWYFDVSRPSRWLYRTIKKTSDLE